MISFEQAMAKFSGTVSEYEPLGAVIPVANLFKCKPFMDGREPEYPAGFDRELYERRGSPEVKWISRRRRLVPGLVIDRVIVKQEWIVRKRVEYFIKRYSMRCQDIDLVDVVHYGDYYFIEDGLHRFVAKLMLESDVICYMDELAGKK